MYDGATNLNYAGDRYYDSSSAKFLSEDPLFLSLGDPKQLGDIMDKMGKSNRGASGGNDQNKDRAKQLENLLSDPQKLNSYSYARNNPLKYNDPTGNGPEMVAPLMLIPGVGEVAAIGIAAVGTAAILAYSYNQGHMPMPDVGLPGRPDANNPKMPDSKDPKWVRIIGGAVTVIGLIEDIIQNHPEVTQAQRIPRRKRRRHRAAAAQHRPDQ